MSNAMISPYCWVGMGTKPELYSCSPEAIITEICKRCKISEEQIFEKTRLRKVLNARQTACYVIRKLHPRITLKKLGAMFSQDHTSIIHSIQRIQDMIDSYPKDRRNISGLLEDLGGFKEIMTIKDGVNAGVLAIDNN